MKNSFGLVPSSKLHDKMVSANDSRAMRVGVAGTGLLASGDEREALATVKLARLQQITREKVLSYVLEGDERVMLLGISHTEFVNEFGAVLVSKLVHCRFGIFESLDAGLERISKSNWPEDRKLEQIEMLKEEAGAILLSMTNAMDMLRRTVEETAHRVSATRP